MRAGVSGNAIEVRFSPEDVALLALSALIVVGLMVLAGWQIALEALGVSLLGAGIVLAVQAVDGATGGSRREGRGLEDERSARAQVANG